MCDVALCVAPLQHCQVAPYSGDFRGVILQVGFEPLWCAGEQFGMIYGR